MRDFAAEAVRAAAARAAAAAGPAESVGSVGGSAEAECDICLDAPEEPMVAPCGHVFCKTCIKDALSQERRCGGCCCCFINLIVF